jgi:hypothetical protein
LGPDLYDQLFAPVSYAPVRYLSEFLVAAPDPGFKREGMLAVVVERSDDVLRKSGTRLSAIGTDRLRRAVAAALQTAALDLRKMEQFAPLPAGSMNPPAIDASPTKTSAAVTFDSLVAGWALEKRPVEKTRYMWERVFKELAGEVGLDDAARLTADDVVRWKEERGLSPRSTEQQNGAAQRRAALGSAEPQVGIERRRKGGCFRKSEARAGTSRIHGR